MPPPSKRPRVTIRHVQEAGLRSSARAIKRAFDSIGREAGGPEVSSDSVATSTQRYASGIRTPCGYVLEQLRVPLADGGHVEWTIANPFALIWHLCSISVGFSSLMARHLANKVGTLVFWGDETTAGNQQRHDSRNKFVAVYWVFKELPEAWRTSDHGWFPL
eukprot:2958659-Pyramimonas_sp.AAC.2